jgi:hypothetical protein
MHLFKLTFGIGHSTGECYELMQTVLGFRWGTGWETQVLNLRQSCIKKTRFSCTLLHSSLSAVL